MSLIYNKKEFCSNFCQHPICWDNALYVSERSYNNNKKENMLYLTNDNIKIKKKNYNSDLQTLTVNDLILNNGDLNLINKNINNYSNKIFSKQLQFTRNFQKTSNIKETTKGKKIASFDPYVSRKCLIWMPSQHCEESFKSKIVKKDTGTKFFNAELGKNEIFEENYNEKNIKPRKIKTIPPTGGQPYRNFKTNNKELKFTDEMVAEILGLSTETLKYILSYSGEEHKKTDKQLIEKNNQKSVDDLYATRKLKSTFILSENNSLGEPTSRFPSSKESIKIRDSIKSFPTRVELDLPPLEIGILGPKPFKYNKNVNMHLSLEPIKKINIRNESQIPTSARSKKATISPDTLFVEASCCSTPYNVDIENYFKSGSSHSHYFSKKNEKESSNEVIVEIPSITSNAFDKNTIPPPPSPNELKNIRNLKNHKDSLNNENHKDLVQGNHGMTLEAYNEIGDFLSEDLSPEQIQNVDNKICMKDLEANLDSNIGNNRIDLLSPIIEEQKHF